MSPLRPYDLRGTTERAARAAFDWLGQWDKAKGDAAAMAAMADRVLHLSDGHIVKESRNAERAAVTSLQW